MESLITEAVNLVGTNKDPNAGPDDPGPKHGYRSAAKTAMQNHYSRTLKWVHINHNTVSNRHRGLMQSRRNASYVNAYLTRPQELTVVSYAIEVANRGFPLTKHLLCEVVNAILKAEDHGFAGVGSNWANWFVERHWTSLQAYWSTPLESVWGKAVNPANLKHFYDILEKLEATYRFKPWNIYGSDESGLMSGVAQKERVIASRGKKTQHQKCEVNC
jgi:hypothetical protein